MTETRAIWHVTKNGVTSGWKWALVRTPAEVDLGSLPPNVRASRASDQQKLGWAAALTAEEAADPAFDATPSLWRRVPELVRGEGAAVSGRQVAAHGVRYHLDDRGRPHPSSSPDSVCEPLQPDAEIVDESALFAHAEASGRALELVERGTQVRVRVLPSRPAGAADADLAVENVRVLVKAADGRRISRIG